ncbi:MAG: hypothetical protein ACXAC5_20135 [Promethearchaeota archaeon]|jgi:hypothetical protein
METKNSSVTDKKEVMQYFDLFFGLFNTFVMSFMVLINLTSLSLAIIAHVFIIILLIGMIFTYLKKNPFFMLFVIGTVCCGAYYSLAGILIIPSTNFSFGIFDYIIFGVGILEVFYIIIKTKDSSLIETWSRMSIIRERGQYDPNLYLLYSDPEMVKIQEEKALVEELKEKQKKQAYYKQYRRSWIISISVISAVGYILAYFSSFGL